jgi:predicted cobalt transporter CbtA
VVPMTVWGWITLVAILAAMIGQVVIAVFLVKTRRQLNRVLTASVRIRAEALDSRDEARAAASHAAAVNAATRELHRHFVEGMAVAGGMRDQCGEILEDMRALRGWPSDEVKRHPGPTPGGGEDQ